MFSKSYTSLENCKKKNQKTKKTVNETIIIVFQRGVLHGTCICMRIMTNYFLFFFNSCGN